MPCEMCGVDERLVDTVVEGSMLKLCSRCKAFGRIVQVKEKRPGLDSRKRNIFVEDVKETSVSNCSDLIKHEREKRGWDQKKLAQMTGEKQSWVHKIESGRVTLSPDQAKKFEKLFSITLTERYKGSQAVPVNEGDEGFTIGDLVNIKKKLK